MTTTSDASGARVLAVQAYAKPAGYDKPAVRVLVVDDHVSFAEALSLSMAGRTDVECTGLATTIDEAVRSLEATPADVVLMDLTFPEGNGIDATRSITQRWGQTRVIVLTGNPEVSALASALAAGASGFISKASSLSDIIEAVTAAPRRGVFVVGASLEQMLREVYNPRDHGRARDGRADALTPREQEILALISEGVGTAGMAALLGISVHTCRGHIKNILVKLGAHSRLEMVATAARLGLVRGAMHKGAQRRPGSEAPEE